MFTMIVLAWGLGIFAICVFMWGTQCTQISRETARRIEIDMLEKSVWDRNHLR